MTERSDFADGSPGPLGALTDLARAEISRRDVLKAAGYSSMAAVLAACTGSTTQAAPTKPDITSLKSNRSGASGQANDGQPLTDLITTYQKQTGREVDVTVVDHNAFQQNGNPLAYLLENPPSDILTWFPGERMRYFAGKGLLLDISDVISQVSGFSPAIKDLISASAGLGKQYFMPTDYFYYGTFYYKSVFQKHGYQIPTTWDQFIALCKQIQKDGMTPLAMPNKPQYPGASFFDAINLGVNGYAFHSQLLAGQQSFQSPQVTKVFQLFAELIPFINANPNSIDIPDILPKFAAGDPVILYDSSVHGLRAANNANNLSDLDFFPFPTIDPSVENSVEAPAEGFMATAKGRNPKGAKELLLYMSKPDVQSKYAAGLKALPVNNEAPLPTDVLSQKGLKLVREAKHVTQYFDRDSSPAFSAPALVKLQQFYDDPTTGPDVQKAWDAYMKAALAAG